MDGIEKINRLSFLFGIFNTVIPFWPESFLFLFMNEPIPDALHLRE